MSIPQRVIRLSATLCMKVMICTIILFVLALVFGLLEGSGGSFRTATLLAISTAAIELAYFGWLLCVGLVSNQVATSSLRTQSWIAVGSFPPAVIYMGWLPYLILAEGSPSDEVFLLHSLMILVNFYILWFASRSIHAAELERPPTLKNYSPTFLLLWYAVAFPPAVKWTHERVRESAGVAATSLPRDGSAIN